MVIPIIAALVTALGAGGLVLSSLLHASAASDNIFNAASVCLVAGPLIFFAYVIFGLWMEFLDFSKPGQKSGTRIVAHTPSPDVVVAVFSQAAYYDGLPEGLRRERKGPLNPSTGRASRI
jgi:hypothetical protein